MPTRLRVLIAVAVVMLSLGIADQCYAALAGGSRLLYYYRETSFSAGGSGLTLFTVTNNNTNPVTVRFVVFNGANCNTAGPFNTTLAAGETKQIAVTDFAPASTFPSGVIDLWAVNGANQAIRFDALTGTSVIADFGPSSTAATIVPAVKMFSDDRTQTGVNTDQTKGITAAPLAIGAPLLLAQTPVAIEDTTVLFSPNTNPGQVPPPSTGNSMITLTLFAAGGGPGTQQTVATSCVYTNTIAGTFGQGVGPGHVTAQGGAGKGIAGWKFLKFNQGGISVLLGELMQAWGTFDLPSSNQ